MNRIGKNLVYGFFYTIAIMPLWFLYCISDVTFMIVYYIIHYRRKTVRCNLTAAFPEKSDAEITSIEKEYYHHFCDTFFETVKMLNFSEARIKRHFIFKNDELAEYFLNEGRPVILVSGHYGNWEWGASIALWIKPDEKRTVGYVYRPLKNKFFDYLYVRIREKFNSVGYVKNNIFRDIVKIKRDGRNWLMNFLSDQKPSSGTEQHKVMFLNQETAVMTGTAKIARLTGAAVCYVEITKIRRSYYEAKIKLITDTPAELKAEEITEKYMQMLEKNILKNPAYYLWSHNRWKKMI